MRTEIVLLILGMGAVTFLTRFAPFVFLSRAVFPERVARVMKFVPVAVLSTLIAPAVLLPGGTPDFSLSNAAVPAAVVTLVAALKTRNTLFSVLCGMGAVILFRHWL